jgi:hypothetical protein
MYISILKDAKPTRAVTSNMLLLKDLKRYLSSKIMMILFYEEVYKADSGFNFSIEKLKEAVQFVEG